MHTLPLITRPAKHSGVTFGAATSVLLTVAENVFAVRRYKKGGAVGSHAPLSNWYCWSICGRRTARPDGTRLRIHVRGGGQTQGTASKEKPTRRKALGGVQSEALQKRVGG